MKKIMTAIVLSSFALMASARLIRVLPLYMAQDNKVTLTMIIGVVILLIQSDKAYRTAVNIR